MGRDRWKQTETKRNTEKRVINWTELEKRGNWKENGTRTGREMRTGRELDGTGRGRKRCGNGNGRERDENGK